jgi:hypothetical protein
MRSCWSGEDDQLVGGVDVAVVVRWGPGSTRRCGTRMARAVTGGANQGDRRGREQTPSWLVTMLHDHRLEREAVHRRGHRTRRPGLPCCGGQFGYASRLHHHGEGIHDPLAEVDALAGGCRAHLQLRRDAQVELIASLRVVGGPSGRRGRRQDAECMELIAADQRPVNDLVEEFVLGRLERVSVDSFSLRAVKGGPDRRQPGRSGQGRLQAARGRRQGWAAAVGSGERGQRQRRHHVRGGAGRHPADPDAQRAAASAAWQGPCRQGRAIIAAAGRTCDGVASDRGSPGA